VWLLIRLWLGYEWLMAALGKWAEGGWVGEGAGGAVKGFAQGAMAQATGEHPRSQAGTPASWRTWWCPTPRSSPTW